MTHLQRRREQPDNESRYVYTTVVQNCDGFPQKHTYTQKEGYKLYISLKSPHHLLIHLRKTVGSTARIGVGPCATCPSSIGWVGIGTAAITAIVACKAKKNRIKN